MCAVHAHIILLLLLLYYYTILLLLYYTTTYTIIIIILLLLYYYYYTIDQAMYFSTDMFTFLSFPWLVNKARAFPSLTYTFSIIKSP